MAIKIKNFEVTARLIIISSVTVAADTFEEALEKSKSLKDSDFVTVEGEYLDGSIQIMGVNKSKAWDTEQ